jgi:diguanylate cyclase (GGDEF)-like protein
VARFSVSIPVTARRDPVTGLLDRQAILDALTPEDGRGVHVGATLIVDINRFSSVNHQMGFRSGDAILRTVALRLQSRLRGSDHIARIGNDEFVIVLGGRVDVHVATEVAGRLLSAVATPMRLGDDEVFITASIGISLPEATDTVADDMLRRAAAALARAKAGGPNRYLLASPEDRAPTGERLKIEAALRRAFEHRQLEVHYQPEFELLTGRILAAEALVRWQHPDHGLMSASQFIDIAEDTGLVDRLGTWVLGEALGQAVKWGDGPDAPVLRVNLSASQLADDTIVIDLRNALADNPIDPARLCVEVTESQLLKDLDESVATLTRLKGLGISLAVDDFGTGFSSLTHLKRLPIDVLKIDKSFVDGIGVDAEDTAIVTSMIELGQSLGLDVVAEGIERQEQVELLLAMGCTRGQGFHLARPMPGADFHSMIGAMA